MPESNIVTVPIPQSVRNNIYRRLGVENALITADPRSQQVLRTFRRSTAPVQVELTQVSIRNLVEKFTVMNDNLNVVIDQVPLSVASKVVSHLFGTKTILEEEEPGLGSRAILRSTSKYNQKQWEASHTRNERGVYVNRENSGVLVAVSELYVLVERYHKFVTVVRPRMLRNLLNVEEREMNKKPVLSGRGSFKTFFESFRANLKVTENPLSDIEILPRGTRSSRRWGIEIEHPDIAGVGTPQGWFLHGDSSIRAERVRTRPDHSEECVVHQPPACGHPAEDGCTNDCDCGFVNTTGARTETGEWSSPILRSFHSRGLKYLMTQLADRQWNYSAGIHVHVEASDLTPEQAARVSLLYTAFEPLFQDEYNRQSREYCKEVSTQRVIKRVREFKQFQESPAWKEYKFSGAPYDDRYTTVNLSSLPNHGTIEFRAMGPRYDYDHLVRWASFLREIVNMARAGVPQKEWGRVRNFRELIVLMSKWGKETPTPEWAKDLPAKDIVTGLGKEGRRNIHTRPYKNTVELFDDYTSRETVLADTRRGR